VEPLRRWLDESRASTLDTCNLSTRANTRKHVKDLLIPVGQLAIDKRLRLFEYSHLIALTLALNRVGFSEGSSPHGLLPIRSIVGRASYLLRSAQHACRPRVLAGTRQVIIKCIYLPISE
jgi:hypothetical protein